VRQQRRYVGLRRKSMHADSSNAATSSVHSGYEHAVDTRSERSDDVYSLRYDGRDKAGAGSRTRVVATRHTSTTRGYCGRIGGLATTDESAPAATATRSTIEMRPPWPRYRPRDRSPAPSCSRAKGAHAYPNDWYSRHLCSAALQASSLAAHLVRRPRSGRRQGRKLPDHVVAEFLSSSWASG
jgi:hypothetical protein